MTKQSKGIILLVSGLLFYLAYWAVLLTVVQSKYANTGSYPAFLVCLLASIVIPSLAITSVYTGHSLMKDKAFNVEHTAFTFNELFKSKGYWALLFIIVAVTIAGTIAWRNDL